jgi:hypothetical protein
MLSVPLAAIWAAGSFFDEGFSPRVRRSATIALASLGAVCLNPFGIGLPRYAIELVSSPFKNMISEWKRTDIGDPSFGFGSMPLLLCAAAFGVRGSGRWRDRLLLIALAVLMFSAARNVAIFALAIMPVAAAALTREVRFFARPERPAPGSETRIDRIAARLIPAFSLALALGVTVGLLRSEKRSEDTQPSRALAALTSLPGPHRVFCADFAWCSFIVERHSGSVFLDGRADPYPERVWDDYLTVARLRGAWRTTLDAHHVDTIVTARDSALDDALSRVHGWQTSYADRRYRVWIRT